MPAPPVAAVAQPEPTAVEEESPPENGEETEQMAAQQQALEDKFYAESMDGAWASMAQRNTRSQLLSLLPPTSFLRDVDCRSSMCRVDVLHPNEAASRRFIDQAFGQNSDGSVWNGPTRMMPVTANSDGTLLSVVYLGRDADSLIPDPRTSSTR